MRYDRILGEMFWHIALLGLHLNPGQGAASGEHVDPRRAVVERAGDIHSGETAAENGDRALTAEACPQAETTPREQRPRYRLAAIRRYRQVQQSHPPRAAPTWRASGRS